MNDGINIYLFDFTIRDSKEILIENEREDLVVPEDELIFYPVDYVHIIFLSDPVRIELLWNCSRNQNRAHLPSYRL